MSETIYFGGPIITMETPVLPEAVLVQNGRIAGIGDLYDLREVAPDAKLYDLCGHTMLPAFIDAHSHITNFASTLGLVELSGAPSFDALAQRLQNFATSVVLSAGQWISGFGYDHNFLAEKAHPTKELLDMVSADHPIIIAHASGHMGVCNSAALAALGISAASPDPEGGKIGRMPGSCEPSGYLEETAFTMIGSKIPQPTTEQLLGQLERAQDIYLSYGIATVQDGLTRTPEWALLRAAAEQKKLKLDIVSYIDLNLCKELAQDNPYFKTYRDHLKLGGYKIFLDGSPQGRTAWITEDYLGQAGDHGYPIYDTTRVKDFMVQALTEDTQILVHCNGDAAAQQLLDAYRDAMAETGKSGIRPVMIHAQLLRRDQLALLPPLGMIASFFVAHTRYWGDVHLENLGKDRADYISPVQSAIQHGVRYTFHQDTPVLPPDMLDTVQCAVERKTKGGQLLAQSECVSVYDALKAVTINAAYQYFEEYTKGSIAVGKVADFVVLDQDPLHTPLESLRNIRVLNTIKHGVVVYTNHT